MHDAYSLLPGVLVPDGEPATRLDIRPTQTIDVLRQSADGYEFAQMRWGFDVSWSKRLLINAKSESMDGRWWTSATAGVVFASAFYEWPMKKGGKKPANYARHHFTIKDQPVMMLAALWRTWSTKDGDPVDCAVIGTTAPNSLFEKLPHHRMAAILTNDNFGPWMNSEPADRAGLLGP